MSVILSKVPRLSRVEFGRNLSRKSITKIINSRNYQFQSQHHYSMSVQGKGEKMAVKFFILEAFTVGNNQKHTGNPAGVCILKYDDDIPDEEKQKIASTLNQSVTAFVSTDWTKSKPHLSTNPPTGQGSTGQVDGGGTHKILKRTLRWFTPIKEIELCGHATLATSFGLLDDNEGGEKTIEKIEFHSKSRGIISASAMPNDEESPHKTLIGLHFPANYTTKISLQSTWLPNLVKTILGPGFAFDHHFSLHNLKDVQYCERESILLLRLKRNPNEKPLATIQRVCPNFDQLLQVGMLGEELKVEGFIVTIEGDKKGPEAGGEREPHFYSRFFGPHIGINEDMATGVSHTILTPYWTKELGFDQEKILRARQASPGRGGEIHCLVEKGGERVRLEGRARILVKGQLDI